MMNLQLLQQANFSSAERAAWRPPENISVSEWAAQHRVLPKGSAFPGPWKNELGPYAVGVMDAFNEPGVERITIMASVQAMKTESVYNMLGWIICQDPAPVLVVMPTDHTLKRVNRRLRLNLWASPELTSHLTGNVDDLQFHQITLDRMAIYFATAGSDAALQNIEARYIICDETDEYPVSETGDPVEKAVDRSTTYWNRKILELSRPTTPEGYINRSYNSSDKRKYWVPCPHCGGYQVLSFRQIKHMGEVLGEWPADKRDPEYIKQQRVARYECRHCQAEIEERERPAMLARGKWVPEGWPIEVDGVTALPPRTSHIGFWWNVLYSPFRTWSQVAAKFFEVKEDRDKRKVFMSQWLAEPWVEVAQVREPCALIEGDAALTTRRPALEVPDNTVALTLGADNHKRGIAAAVWAWERVSPKVYNQHLIRYGWLADFKELEGWIFEDVYHNQAGSLTYRIWRAALDTGGGEGYSGDATLTTQAYEWLRRWGHQGRVFGIKGASGRLRSGKHLEYSPRDKMPGGKPIPGGLKLFILDTHALKDDFWARVEMGRVHLHAGTGEDFARELTAEAKEYDHRRKQWLWAQQGNKPNHYLDSTIYANAMADPELVGLEVMPVPRPAARRPPGGPEENLNPVTGLPRGDYWR